MLLKPLFRKFVVTTSSPRAKRAAKDDERMLARAKIICPKSIESKACECLYTCPPMVTRDRRKTVREIETGTFAEVSSARVISLKSNDQTNTAVAIVYDRIHPGYPN
jgi:hypothetical protein